MGIVSSTIWRGFNYSGRSSDLSSHFEEAPEDLVTSTQDTPALRQEAQNMLDDMREMRKRIDSMRIDELAQKRLQQST